MPSLSAKSIDPEVLVPQLSPSTLVAIQSTQLMVEKLNEIYIEPARMLSEKLNEVYLEPWKRMGESLSKMFEVQNLALGKIIAADLSLSKIFSNSLLNIPTSTFKAPSIFEPLQVIDLEGEYAELPKTDILALPEPLEVRTIKPILHSALGVDLLANGNFLYRRKLIKNLSLNNKTGKLFQLFLLNKPHFASHIEIQKKLGIEADKGYAYTFSHILKHLKRIFRDNGYIVEIICQRGQGYFLQNIKPLSN